MVVLGSNRLQGFLCKPLNLLANCCPCIRRLSGKITCDRGSGPCTVNPPTLPSFQKPGNCMHVPGLPWEVSPTLVVPCLLVKLIMTRLLSTQARAATEHFVKREVAATAFHGLRKGSVTGGVSTASEHSSTPRDADGNPAVRFGCSASRFS